MFVQLFVFKSDDTVNVFFFFKENIFNFDSIKLHTVTSYVFDDFIWLHESVNLPSIEFTASVFSYDAYVFTSCQVVIFIRRDILRSVLSVHKRPFRNRSNNGLRSCFVDSVTNSR